MDKVFLLNALISETIFLQNMNNHQLLLYLIKAKKSALDFTKSL